MSVEQRKWASASGSFLANQLYWVKYQPAVGHGDTTQRRERAPNGRVEVDTGSDQLAVVPDTAPPTSGMHSCAGRRTPFVLAVFGAYEPSRGESKQLRTLNASAYAATLCRKIIQVAQRDCPTSASMRLAA